MKKLNIKIIFTALILFFASCTSEETPENIEKQKTTEEEKVNKNSVDTVQHFTIDIANQLIDLPLTCVEQEYPNKLGQVIGSAKDLKSPKELHPAFYGCFDWHSSVHGHWSMVKLLKEFPNMVRAEEVKNALRTNLTKENIEKEILFFDSLNPTFERTYGWAWMLKLCQETNTWDDSLGRDLSFNLQPLEMLLREKFMEFLPKLNYPIRVGEHSNTAFAMGFAHDYAKSKGDTVFLNLIESRAKEFYVEDEESPINYEPSGYDFISPSLEEANLMRKVLSREEFKSWFEKFLPTLFFAPAILDVGEVSDRKDGKLVHLDGLNFSRAWCLYGIGNSYEEYSHLIEIADEHLMYSLPHLIGDSYEGGHWLGSFAIYALSKQKVVD